jgi:hypothetical protein
VEPVITVRAVDAEIVWVSTSSSLKQGWQQLIHRSLNCVSKARLWSSQACANSGGLTVSFLGNVVN